MQNNKKFILGIETSCDDTCLAVLDFNYNIIKEYKFSQDAIHTYYGGVVPEIAARSHIEKIQILLQQLKQEIDLTLLAAVAVTYGPGLIGSLMIGLLVAKGITSALSIPLIAINHLEGHIMSAKIDNTVLEYPFLLLLVSGGNSQIIITESFGSYKIIGLTLDDSAGEILDKIGKILGLGYPSGPEIEKLATMSLNKDRFSFYNPKNDKLGLNMSFSGLKTKIITQIKTLQNLHQLDQNTIHDLCFATQEAVILLLKTKIEQAIVKFIQNYHGKYFVLCGGVAANEKLRSSMDDLAKQNGLKLIMPPIKYSSDNAVMIAIAGIERYKIQDFANQNLQPFAKITLD